MASSRADCRSKKEIPERSTSVGPRRDETSVSILSKTPRLEMSHSPHNSTNSPSPDSRASIPYNVSRFPYGLVDSVASHRYRYDSSPTHLVTRSPPTLRVRAERV